MDKRGTCGTERRHSYYILQQRRASVGRGAQRTEREKLNPEEKLRPVTGKVATEDLMLLNCPRSFLSFSIIFSELLSQIHLLQGIFPNQGSNPGLLHCRWIPYCLSHQ